jgi:hypothetical protein
MGKGFFAAGRRSDAWDEKSKFQGCFTFSNR